MRRWAGDKSFFSQLARRKSLQDKTKRETLWKSTAGAIFFFAPPPLTQPSSLFYLSFLLPSLCVCVSLFLLPLFSSPLTSCVSVFLSYPPPPPPPLSPFPGAWINLWRFNLTGVNQSPSTQCLHAC